MNKKKLSVVMAGAMLATSVAPVLAAEENTMSAAELGLLIKEVRETLVSKTFTDTREVAGNRNGNESGKSVYYIKVNGVKVAAADIDLTAANANTTLQGALQDALGGLAKGAKVEIWSKGFEEEGDKVYANGLQKTYTEDFLETATLTTLGLNTATTLIDVQPSYTKSSKSIELTFKGDLKGGYANENAKTKMVIKEGDRILDFSKYIDGNGNPQTVSGSTAPGVVCGFPVKEDKDLEYTNNYADTLVKTTVITEGGNSFKTSDLYDGLMLTTKGHDLLATVKDKTNKSVKYSTVTGLSIGSATYTLPKNEDGTYSFSVSIETKFDGTKTYTITGDKEETQTLLKWLYSKHANIDLLAGDDRYETAVKIAEEYAGINETTTAANISDIVLVNGDSLVDGLAAAPLASVLSEKTGGTKKAPIVLTESDKLPTATRDYLVRILKATGNISTTPTIHLVGGTAVISRNLQKELTTLGFNVVRYNGENREETSMKVAEKVLKESDNKTNVFVVGASGSADAMSIAPIAAKKDAQAPIIVAKGTELSYDGLDFVDTITNANVKVIGGEKAFSEDAYEALKDGIDKSGSLKRISGANRKETNALIINEFYSTGIINSDVDSVIVAKDGIAKEGQLIDALTAANLASEKKAPIVLATDSLSTEQINALELKAKSANNVYQVGLGVNPSVVKTVAQRLGLVK